MLQSMIKTAWRNLKRQKGYSLVGIIGLAVGLAYFAMIAVLEDLHFNADAFHRNLERLYGVVQVNDAGQGGEAHALFSPGPLLAALRSEFPAIADGCRVLPAGRQIVRRGGNVFYERSVLFVDAGFLSLFSFPLVSGDRASALSQPYSAVLSRRAAEKYFGQEDPLGKALTLNRSVNVTVTAVARDLYENSSIDFDLLVSMDAARSLFPGPERWDKSEFSTFLLLARGADPRSLQARLPLFLKKYFPAAPPSPKRLYLFPFGDFRLKAVNPVRIQTFFRQVEPEVIWMQYLSAIIVLLIACFNFMILSTSRHMRRAREIAMRKALGADRRRLIGQFLVESLVTALLALPLALLFYAFAFPAMTQYMGYSQALPVWRHPFLFKYLIGLTAAVGLFAGSYPAFFLSKFNPTQVLKGSRGAGRRGQRLRKVLVVTQFSLVIFLILWTLMFKKQFRHFLDVDYGYDRSRVLAALVKNVPAGDLQVLKKELARLPAVASAAASWNLPGTWNSLQKVVPEGADEDRGWQVSAYGVDEDFTATVGIELLQGRAFSRAFNDRQSLLINETLARQLGWDSPLGRRLALAGRQATVVGVVRDFQFRDPGFPVGPALFYMETESPNYLLLKFRPGTAFPALRRQVASVWERTVRDTPLETVLLDDHFRQVYSWMDKVFVIMTVLNTVILFVACLGLLGLVSFAVERRTKEVGIRKVMGASAAGIFGLIAREFVWLVALANLAGILLGAWIIGRIFRMMIFTNRVSPDAGIFLLTAVMTFGAMLLAVSWEIARAARANPVDSLRYE